MSTKAKWIQQLLHFFESASEEIVDVMAPVYFYDDFLYKTLNVTDFWGARDAGAATEALATDGLNGIVALALDATNEIQVAGLDFGDHRPFPLAGGLNIAFRARFTVLPTGSVVACMGMCGDYNAAVNTVAESVWFRCDGNGVVTVEHDDTSNESSQVATGITMSVNVWYDFRIDMSDPTNVKFYINGNRVAASTTFNMNQVAALQLQPIFRIGKEGAATTVGTLQIDYARVWHKRP